MDTSIDKLKGIKKYKKFDPLQVDPLDLPYKEGDIIAYPKEVKLIKAAEEEDYSDEEEEVSDVDENESENEDDVFDEADEDREEEDIYDDEEAEKVPKISKPAPKAKPKAKPKARAREKKNRIVQLDTFVMQKVKITDDPVYEQYMIDMGLETSKYEFVKKSIKLKVEEAKLQYGAYEFMMFKKGKLIPYNPYSYNEIRVIDEAHIPARNRDERSDEQKISAINETIAKYKKEGFIVNPLQNFNSSDNPYHPIYKKGTMVEFVKNGIKVEGIVMSHTETHIGVVPRRPRRADMTFVEYIDPSLKVIAYAKSPVSLVKDPTADDIYSMKDIPQDIRKTVRELYYRILNELREKPNVPVKESSIKKVINLTVPRGIKTFDEYWSENFKAWIKSIKHKLFVEQLDVDLLSRKAAEKYEEYTDPNHFYNVITDTLGRSLDYTTTLDDLLKAFKQHPVDSVFHGFMITHMTAEKTKGNSDMKGSDLGAFIINMIELFYKQHPSDIDYFYNAVCDMELSHKLETYVPSQDEFAQFEATYGNELRDLHMQMTKEYEIELEAYHKQLEEEETRTRLERAENLGKTAKLPDNTINSENKDQVDKFEEIIFKTHGSTVYEYLKYALYPQMFLEGPLAKHTLYFRAKIADGSYPFSSLVGANIAYYFPEIAMNPEVYPLEKRVVDVRDSIQEHVSNALNYILHYNISVVVDVYINILNPTAKMTSVSQYTYDGVLSFVESFTNYPKLRNDQNNISYVSLLVDPTEICNKETGTGMRYTIINGEYVLDKSGNKGQETIPEEDLVICIDEKGNFACNSIRDVILAISRGDHLNPITGYSYPADLVERVRRKYSKEIESVKAPIVPKWNPVEEKPAPVPSAPIKPVEKAQSPKRQRHIRPLKAPKKIINGVVLKGPAQIYRLLNAEELNFLIEEEENKMEHTVYVTDENEPGVNVAVLSFDFKYSNDNMTSLKDQISDLPDDIEYVYAIGLNSRPVDKVTLQDFKYNIQKKIKSPEGMTVSDVFYVKGDSLEDIRDGLIDVSIAVEGVKVAE